MARSWSGGFEGRVLVQQGLVRPVQGTGNAAIVFGADIRFSGHADALAPIFLGAAMIEKDAIGIAEIGKHVVPAGPRGIRAARTGDVAGPVIRPAIPIDFDQAQVRGGDVVGQPFRFDQSPRCASSVRHLSAPLQRIV